MRRISLHNRYLHISGLLPPEKADVESIYTERMRSFSDKTIAHARKMHDEFGCARAEISAGAQPSSCGLTVLFQFVLFCSFSVPSREQERRRRCCGKCEPQSGRTAVSGLGYAAVSLRFLG